MKEEEKNSQIASENEVLEKLTAILRRTETEDTVIKLRDEVKTTDEDGRSTVERGEHIEIAKLRPKIADVIRAAELIGKHHGIFSETLTGSIALPLIICGEEDLK